MIRHATLADVERLAELARDMHAESRFRELNFNLDKVVVLFAGLVEQENGCMLAVEVGGELVGFLAGGIGEDYFGDDRFSFEYGVYVAPAYRGSMAGPRLVAEFLEWSDERGARYKNMAITTDITTDRTGALYERFGGTNVGNLYSWGL
ncbi:GNAT family N-acetyltransferase [Achromobacter sp. MFA1 R4]|uniref:GNAT family N-acetyltransferase n=1 Tax=Achromobacter sp. MFA1 R4 TaxID=1881016 RepID=UPI00095398D1|nr:GNAT family N-acetyltransferase [Achromobacter sp. MFA1 R4]SIT25385.1 Ribosomal protein S18 acetylase RimI [Achromobacter sp. MFA1 R4]